MKKKWEKPVLIILDKSKPDESVLIPCVHVMNLNACLRGFQARDIR